MLQPLPRPHSNTEDDAANAATAQQQHQHYSNCRVVSRGFEAPLFVASAANVGRTYIFLQPVLTE